MEQEKRVVTLEIGDGFPVALSIEHARALRTVLSNINLRVYAADEQHIKYVEAGEVFGFVCPGGRLKVSAEISTDAAQIDIDASLNLELCDPSPNGSHTIYNPTS